MIDGRHFLPPGVAAAMCVLWSAAVPSLGGQTVSPPGVGSANVVSLPAFPVVEPPLATAPEADEFAATVTRLKPPQLQEIEPLDFASALRRVPGVTITRFNQVGAFGGGEGGAVFLRGLGASRPGGEIKILMDGVPKLNGVFNHPLLDLISVDSAAQVEIHGRATPLEFGNVFASVNVTTPRLESPGHQARMTVAAGSFGTFVERLELGARTNDYDYYFTQSFRRSDGHRADSDGRMENQLLRLGAVLSPPWTASYTVNHTRNRATDPGIEGLPPGPPSTRGERYETEDWLHIATVKHQGPRARGTFRAYHNAGSADWLRRNVSGNDDSLGAWRLYGLRVREQLTPDPDTTILAGVDLDYDGGSLRTVPASSGPPGLFPRMTMRLCSVYSGLTRTFAFRDGKVAPSFGARYYDHNVFAEKWAPQAGVTYAAGKTKLHVGASRGINYPGLEVAVFSHLLIPALGRSWQTLRPEQADQFEAGVRHAINDRATIAMTLFSNRVRQRYVIVFPPPPPPRYANVESFRTEGAEISAEATLGGSVGASIGAALLRTRPDDVPYAPAGTLTAGLNWRVAAGWRLSADGVYVSSMHAASEARVAGAENPLRVGAQFLLNARLTHRFAWAALGRDEGEIYLSAENLTDRTFAYQPGYPIPGVNLMLGLRVKR